MKGSIGFPLSQQMQSNAQVHGVRWAAERARAQGIPLWQTLILLLGRGRGLGATSLPQAESRDLWLGYAHL